MKTFHLTLFIALFFGLGIYSCNKATTNPAVPNQEMPDATVNVTVTGALTQQFSYNLPKQGGNEGAATGGYSTTDNILTYVFLDSNQKASGEKSFGFTATAGSLSTGTYTLNDGSYVDVGNTSFGNLISGTVTVNKVDLYSNLAGGTTIYWTTGNAEYVLQDDSTPPQQITVNCDFTNIYTAKQ